jgi:arabinan endo-1,5-alpha-L-arabinosidase
MRKRRVFSIIILIFICCCLPKQGKALSGDIWVHDPSTINKDGNNYWAFTSGNGINAISSTDLYNWSRGKEVFQGGKWPSWINTYVPNFIGYFWAPDVSYLNGKYYLYYACSTLGSSTSTIGVATSPTLNQSSPDYKWTDLGMVVSSSSVRDVNAIDPSVFKDTNGKVYLTYGSYFNGIGIIELNPSTGKVKAGARIKRIAGGSSSSFEASCLIKEGSYYYLFVNRARCCQGQYSTYYIVTGRSLSPTGPFFDKNGINLRGSGSTAGGTTVLVTSGRYRAPGHLGLLRDSGRSIISTHYYDGNYYGESKLDIADLHFTEDGWPVVSRDLVTAGRYKITNKNSNMVWEASGCTGQEGAQLIQNNDYNFTPCQSWDLTPVGDGYYKISNETKNESVDLPFCNSLNGIKLQTYTWLNTYCQKFKIEQLVNRFICFYFFS